MAARLGEVHYQALHHFLAVSPWDWRPVRRRLAEVMCAALQPTAWVLERNIRAWVADWNQHPRPFI